MKHGQRIISTMLIIITLLAILPISASAAYKVETLKFNQWYNLKDDVRAVYKIRISADTIIEATWKNNKRDDASIKIYTDIECKDDDLYTFLYDLIDSPISGSDAVVLYKGTYYIKMNDGYENTKVRFTKRLNNINKQNYCISRAINMTKNKRYELSQSKNECYKRWYKIKLTKKQVITFYGYYGSYVLYDSNFNVINCKDNKETITTRGSQPKGIYYLALEDGGVDNYFEYGRYFSIYWK